MEVRRIELLSYVCKTYILTIKLYPLIIPNYIIYKFIYIYINSLLVLLIYIYIILEFIYITEPSVLYSGQKIGSYPLFIKNGALNIKPKNNKL